MLGTVFFFMGTVVLLYEPMQPSYPNLNYESDDNGFALMLMVSVLNQMIVFRRSYQGELQY